MQQAPPKTLLLADDGSDEVFLFKRACAKAAVSFSLQIVRDGRQAVDYLVGDGEYRDRNKFPFPDLLLLDINMPVMSGFEVLKWVRAHRDYKHLLVVMFSSSVAEIDVRRAYDLFANSYLEKRLAPVP